MEAFMAWLKSVNDVVWGPGMLVLLVGTGLYLTVGLKFFTFRNFFRGLKNLWAGRSNQSEQGEISPFNALMTALAADIGTGNIVGVSTAIYIGGPGALFWMWVTALVGMATKFSEVLLSVHFREKTPAGNWVGGAMYFIKNGLGPKWMWLGSCFALFGIVACCPRAGKQPDAGFSHPADIPGFRLAGRSRAGPAPDSARPLPGRHLRTETSDQRMLSDGAAGDGHPWQKKSESGLPEPVHGIPRQGGWGISSSSSAMPSGRAGRTSIMAAMQNSL